METQNAGGVDARIEQIRLIVWDVRMEIITFDEAMKRVKEIFALSAVSPDAATVDGGLTGSLLRDALSRLEQARRYTLPDDKGFLRVLDCDVRAVLDGMRAALQAARVPDGPLCEDPHFSDVEALQKYMHDLSLAVWDLTGDEGEDDPLTVLQRFVAQRSLPDGAGGKAVAWQYRFKYGENDVGEWTELRAQDASLRDLPHVETRALYAHPPAPEPSLSREGASVSNAVRGLDSQAIKLLARDIHHAIADDGLAPLPPPEYNALRDPILRTLNRWFATPNPTTLAETAESVDGLVDGVTATPAGQDAAPTGWYAAIDRLSAELEVDFNDAKGFFLDALSEWTKAPDETHLWIAKDELMAEDSYGVPGSSFYRCKLCDGESGAGMLNKGIPHQWDCPLKDNTPTERAPRWGGLTDEQIVEIRDELLPSQGERFDCIAFARAILSASAARSGGDAEKIGGTVYFDREESGVVIDALIEHRASAEKRYDLNSASNSNWRADKCAELIGRINGPSALQPNTTGEV